MTSFFILSPFYFLFKIKIERKEVFWIIFTFPSLLCVTIQITAVKETTPSRKVAKYKIQETVKLSHNMSKFLHDKCFCCMTSWSRKVKNTKHQPKTCNKTILCNKMRSSFKVAGYSAVKPKMRGFVSRIWPPPVLICKAMTAFISVDISILAWSVQKSTRHFQTKL